MVFECIPFPSRSISFEISATFVYVTGSPFLTNKSIASFPKLGKC